MTDAEKVELAIRRFAAKHSDPEVASWFEDLADEIAMVGAKPQPAPVLGSAQPVDEEPQLDLGFGDGFEALKEAAKPDWHALNGLR